MDWIMTFHQIGNGIPTDFNSIIFQRGWLKPPTRKCWGTEATGVHVDDFTQKTIDFSGELWILQQKLRISLAKKGKESG